MHSVVMENLEEFLAGTLESAERQTLEKHLSECMLCRDEVHNMQGVSLLLHTFRSDEVMEPAPGFYARVMLRTEQPKSVPFSALFALDSLFARKLVYSCLLTLGVLVGYLVSSEQSYMAGPTPEAIMAAETHPTFESAPAPESMLVTLTNYEH